MGYEIRDVPLIAALDVGTSWIRALLYDAQGRAVPGAQAAMATPFATTADGGAEADPGRLVQACVDCLGSLLAQAGELAGQIEAVAVCTFWHSLLGVDEGGRPLTPIYTWADVRPSRARAWLQRRIDERAVHARTGAPLHASYWPAKLAWLRRRNARLFGRTRHWLSPGEYLFLCLFGTMLCSVSMASGTGIFDQSSLDWDAELLELLGIERSQLSPVVDLEVSLRGLREPYRSALPPLAQVPWFAALGDGACSNVGLGCVGRERVALMLATSGALRVLFTGAAPQPPWGLWCYRADRRRPLVGGALSNGGNLYAWLLDTLRLPRGPALEAELAAMEPDGHGLTLLPFLAGERSPGYAPDATAVITGLRWHTQPREILRAGLEAVAYRLALIHELLAPVAAPGAEIIASGGGLAELPAWAQIIADVLARPVTMAAVSEASSRGAALLAAEALGLLTDVAKAPLEPGRVYEPDERRHARYLHGLARQQRLYRKLLGRGKTGPHATVESPPIRSR